MLHCLPKDAHSSQKWMYLFSQKSVYIQQTIYLHLFEDHINVCIHTHKSVCMFSTTYKYGYWIAPNLSASLQRTVPRGSLIFPGPFRISVCALSACVYVHTYIYMDRCTCTVVKMTIFVLGNFHWSLYELYMYIYIYIYTYVHAYVGIYIYNEKQSYMQS